MCLMPFPGAVDDGLDRIVPGRPAELLANPARVGHELGWIAGSPGRFDGGGFVSGNLPRGVDPLFDRGTVAAAEIEHVALLAGERAHVCRGEIDDVNVITDARAVGSGIIGAEDLDVWALAQRDLEDNGNQMRLLAVMFTVAAGRTSRVEVAQTDVLDAVQTVVPVEDFLEHQLRFTVGIDWLFREVFTDGDARGH